ncbi:hypothetical protein CONPUDRAFT_107295 [Coniophora puteana RWD-64-598 SS2]|uniref:DUF1771-domain-containing protein n=1 Tax=Coniophora puteana (strain RWD-64-598) TaxID=741705 RepID=A0A5M3MIT6_CONPW|nr:uncharacterized protein CONPUDRAFT_107295 [Coniophora puteana RWD-64-598 SS2]EIW79169.1 hypothetical protein CONPUDRAFT_107295 [Coniophora puteana RWD-64-598 SS2]
MPPTLTFPPQPALDPDVASEGAPAQPKFPHTRAQLAAIARQHKNSFDSYDGDHEKEDTGHISSSFVSRIATMLANEQEDELKQLLKATYNADDETAEQHVLDLMHRHRDDSAGVPFLFLTPTRRPSRPSSRASNHSFRFVPNRPETPVSNPSSPLTIGFRRPHTPVGSPLVGGYATSYVSAHSISPMQSPTLAHAQAIHAQAQFTSSLPSSPISSPRLLSAKANEFKPIQRPLSAASSNPAAIPGYNRMDTPSPDMWSHSPMRASSNLAIAAPLIPERSLTPSSLRASARPHEEDEEDDPFDPFAPAHGPLSFGPMGASDFDTEWPESMSPDDPRASGQQMPYGYDPSFEDLENGEDQSYLTDGMTPFDVLSSVFGTTLAPSELEEALASNGYDFEMAMAWLIERALPAPPQHQAPRTQAMGNRVTLVSRDSATRGGRGGAKGVNGRPNPGGNRVCRYYLAGECLRADCRFSHDLERALCRFWLRGTCAKHEACEFLHHLPQEMDPSGLSGVMGRMNVGNGNGSTIPTSASPPSEDFPALGFERNGSGTAGRGGYGRNDNWHQDPGRTRFAAAVKRPAPAAPPALNDRTLAARREVMGPAADNLHTRSAIVAPKPSPRVKLRVPTLLPTLKTGEAINSLYMTYRSRALQLGAARNACLSRAADAWRRGDGAAAKRFSREGRDLNAKMGSEMAEAAGKLVRERAALAEQAVKARDLNWSDDMGDRTSRGRTCGGGLGVCLGIASKNIGDGKLTSEERMESVLDLHGLHSNEATEVLEEFLLALEREHFLGLAFVIVGEEKHTGTQDTARGSSRARLAAGVREWLHRWSYPWSERDGIICVDALTHQ